MKMTFKHHALHYMCIITLHLGRAHDVFTIVYHMLMHFSYIRTFNSLYFDKLIVLVLFCMSLFPPSLLLSISCIMAPKWKSTPSRNPLHSRTSTSFDPTPFHVRFCDEKAKSDFFENFSWRGVHSKRQVIYRTSSTLTYPLSFTIRVGSHCVTSRSLVLSCLFRSFTPTCTGLIVQYLSSLLAFEVAHSCHIATCYGCASGS